MTLFPHSFLDRPSMGWVMPNRLWHRSSALLPILLAGGLVGMGVLSPACAEGKAIYLAQAATPTRYTLGAGDQIHVDVFDASEYTGDYQVLADGTISLPMIGVVPIAGLTLDGAASTIADRLGAILLRPITSVQLVTARPIAIAVAGEINRPGSYTLESESTAQSPTVTSAIQLAGGITSGANIRDIQVIRADPQTGQLSQVFTANLWQLVQDGDLQQDLTLQDGDRVIVPEALSPSNSELTALASANISPDAMVVNVVGEVSSPGSISIAPNTPLNQAILAAGGFNRRARKGRVDLVRLNPNGSVTTREIDVDLAADADSSVNPPLRPNDTVIVNRSTFTQVTDAIGR
ncbi:MAG: SLBB domain-containing protein, partial [Elainellaceae cyanobacterium]